ncbi:hypothetical protein [Alteromonas stellipolaris]|uniref:Uncharacterized protein n=1 Tax=Alteromonas stellipolaris TaxID=233316 RepID=A0ABN4LI08_9ALTE|nr:hypothetical protein [Alteromonas stellipolaris]AMJ73198.1 hypothetical protein AVL57_03910 [Alteromonas stellipolaris]
MDFVAFNYFPPNKEEYIKGIAEAISASGIQLTHLGKNDPPRKWSGSAEEIYDVLSGGNDKTNYTFAKDSKNKVDIDFSLGNCPEAITSTISISGKSKEVVERLCLHFSKYVNSFLCISGQLGLGAAQQWTYLLQNDHCPASILDQVKNA